MNELDEATIYGRLSIEHKNMSFTQVLSLRSDKERLDFNKKCVDDGGDQVHQAAIKKMKEYADACKRKVPKKDKAKFEKYIGCREERPRADKRLMKTCTKAVAKKPTKTLERKKKRCRGKKKNKCPKEVGYKPCEHGWCHPEAYWCKLPDLDTFRPGGKYFLGIKRVGTNKLWV